MSVCICMLYIYVYIYVYDCECCKYLNVVECLRFCLHYYKNISSIYPNLPYEDYAFPWCHFVKTRYQPTLFPCFRQRPQPQHVGQTKRAYTPNCTPEVKASPDITTTHFPHSSRNNSSWG